MLSLFKKSLVIALLISGMAQATQPEHSQTDVKEIESVTSEPDSVLNSCYRHIISPVWRGALVAGAYVVGTKGLDALYAAHGMKYEGLMKFLGSMGSVFLGLSVMPGSMSKESKPQDNWGLKFGLWCSSVVVSSAIFNDMITK